MSKAVKTKKIRPPNVYSQIMVHIFERNYTGGGEFEFSRDEIATAAAELGVEAPKNTGDVIYSFRYRSSLPQAILDRQPEGKAWLILVTCSRQSLPVESGFSLVL